MKKNELSITYKFRSAGFATNHCTYMLNLQLLQDGFVQTKFSKLMRSPGIQTLPHLQHKTRNRIVLREGETAHTRK